MTAIPQINDQFSGVAHSDVVNLLCEDLFRDFCSSQCIRQNLIQMFFCYLLGSAISPIQGAPALPEGNLSSTGYFALLLVLIQSAQFTAYLPSHVGNARNICRILCPVGRMECPALRCP